MAGKLENKCEFSAWLIMVIIGGYETFVSRLHLGDHEDQPEWLSHVNAGVLKVKLATALVSISSIHLLKTFIEVRSAGATFNNFGVMWLVIIHLFSCYPPSLSRGRIEP